MRHLHLAARKCGAVSVVTVEAQCGACVWMCANAMRNK